MAKADKSDEQGPPVPTRQGNLGDVYARDWETFRKLRGSMGSKEAFRLMVLGLADQMGKEAPRVPEHLKPVKAGLDNAFNLVLSLTAGAEELTKQHREEVDERSEKFKEQRIQLEDRAEKLRVETDKLKSERGRLKTEQEALKERIDTLEGEKKNRKDETKNLINQIKVLGKRIADGKQTVKTLREELTTLRGQAKKFDTRERELLGGVEKAVKALEDKENGHTLEIAQKEKEHAEALAQAVAAARTDEQEKAKGEIKLLRDTHIERGEAKALRSELKEALDSTRKDEIERIQSRHDDQIEKLKTTINTQAEKIKELEGELSKRDSGEKKPERSEK